MQMNPTKLELSFPLKIVDIIFFGSLAGSDATAIYLKQRAPWFYYVLSNTSSAYGGEIH